MTTGLPGKSGRTAPPAAARADRRSSRGDAAAAPTCCRCPACSVVVGILYPFVLGAYYSFLNYSAANPNPEFVGFANFVSVLSDSDVLDQRAGHRRSTPLRRR